MTDKKPEDKVEDYGIDLNDAATRKMLHDPYARNNQAIKMGLGAGLITGVLGGIESFFMIPYFVKAYKKTGIEDPFLTRLFKTAKGDKLLTVLVAAPAVIAGVAGTWGYVIAKSALQKKELELKKIEKKEAVVSSELIALSPDISDNNQELSKNSWVQKEKYRAISTPQHHGRV